MLSPTDRAAVDALVAAKAISGRANEVVSQVVSGAGTPHRVLVVGLGEEVAQSWREAGAAMAKYAGGRSWRVWRSRPRKMQRSIRWRPGSARQFQLSRVQGDGKPEGGRCEGEGGAADTGQQRHPHAGGGGAGVGGSWRRGRTWRGRSPRDRGMRLIRRAWRRWRRRWRRIPGSRAACWMRRNSSAWDGRTVGGWRGESESAAVDRVRTQGIENRDGDGFGSEKNRDGDVFRSDPGDRQVDHLRHRRHLDQARREDGGNDLRQVRRHGGPGIDASVGGIEVSAARGGVCSRRRRITFRARRIVPATSSRSTTASPSR